MVSIEGKHGYKLKQQMYQHLGITSEKIWSCVLYIYREQKYCSLLSHVDNSMCEATFAEWKHKQRQ